MPTSQLSFIIGVALTALGGWELRFWRRRLQALGTIGARHDFH